MRGAQPPSGGCVLKPEEEGDFTIREVPAAFGRLCVETNTSSATLNEELQPPSGGCVLKPRRRHH